MRYRNDVIYEEKIVICYRLLEISPGFFTICLSACVFCRIHVQRNNGRRRCSIIERDAQFSVTTKTRAYVRYRMRKAQKITRYSSLLFPAMRILWGKGEGIKLNRYVSKTFESLRRRRRWVTKIPPPTGKQYAA